MTANSKRHINAIGILVDLAGEMGVPPQALLAGSGVKQASLADPTTTVSFEQEYRVIRNLLRVADGMPAVGLRIGLRYRFTWIAPVGFAFISSPTFRSAFDVALRYADLNASMVQVAPEGDGRDLRIGFLEERIPADIRAFAVERTIGVILALARELLQRVVTPRSLDLAHASNPVDVYRKLLGVAPRERDRSLLVLKHKDVELPLERANPVALRLAEEQCQRYLETWRRREGLAARVRDIIALQPRNMPPIKQVAIALCMSERTMRRRLSDEGTSFALLCDETRQAIAEQLLTIQRLPLEQIAERLGYSETAAFIHAFKRWHGVSPHAYRLAKLSRRG